MYVETVAQIAVKVNASDGHGDGHGQDGGWVMAIYLFFARLTQFRVNKRVAGKTSTKSKSKRREQQEEEEEEGEQAARKNSWTLERNELARKTCRPIWTLN